MNDERLLQNNPQQFVVRYQKIVVRLIHQFWQKRGVSSGELTIIEEIIFQRLPIQLAKYKDNASQKAYALTLFLKMKLRL